MRLWLPEISQTTKMWFWSLFIAVLAIFSIATQLRWTTFLVILLFTVMIYILISSSTGTDLAGSIPETNYPPPPHLGLNGVSLENQYISHRDWS